jgi:hypothetical protein
MPTTASGLGSFLVSTSANQGPSESDVESKIIAKSKIITSIIISDISPTLRVDLPTIELFLIFQKKVYALGGHNLSA